MPITSQCKSLSDSNNVSHRGEEPQGKCRIQSGGDLNSKPSVSKVLTEPNHPIARLPVTELPERERKAVLSTELNTFNQGIQIIQPEWNKEPHTLIQRARTSMTKGKKDHETDEFGEKGLKGLHCVALSSTQPSGSSRKMKKKEI